MGKIFNAISGLDIGDKVCYTDKGITWIAHEGKIIAIKFDNDTDQLKYLVKFSYGTNWHTRINLKVYK